MAEPKPKLVKLEIALFYLFSSNFSAYFIKSDCMKSIANGLSKNINTVRRKHSVLVVSIFFFFSFKSIRAGSEYKRSGSRY